MKNCDAKIVMITMFRNEAGVLRRMLDSCTGRIDYWVIQDNGSTDGSPDIVRQWAEETGIPGHLYQVEEGWKGFGWNRDHLIQVCQGLDHGCDWILKMDCDEVLEVDHDFDWSVFDRRKPQAFNVTAVSGDCYYYRSWIWNADLPWRFNHDPCHETIYCELEDVGHNYTTENLPSGFRQAGYNEGQSWSVPTKYITDSLVLEEKMIREGNMLEDLYHFWYIGKSYNDARPASAFPLGKAHQDEYARRAIWYLNQYINKVQADRGGRTQEDEMCYIALIMIAECYEWRGELDLAIVAYRQADQFAPGRNDHLYPLAVLYKQTQQYDLMLEITTHMMQPERTCAFPNYCLFVDASLYHDSSSGKVQDLHQQAVELCQQHSTPAQTSAEYGHTEEPNMNHTYQTMPTHHEHNVIAPVCTINRQGSRRMFIVDHFYEDPDSVRDFALNHVEYHEDLRYYKGYRSKINYHPPGIKEAFEDIIGCKIQVFDEHAMNGCFQITRSCDPQVYHFDDQRWAAMIYLTPDAPFQSGTRFHASKINGSRHADEHSNIIDAAFDGDFYDSTKFHTVDSAGNVYNRCVIIDARHIHSAGSYFGNTMQTGRLTHLFFFD